MTIHNSSLPPPFNLAWPSTAQGVTSVEGEVIPPFETIFRMHLDRVVRTLRHLHVPTADVHDVAQDVFITVHRLLPTYEPRAKLSTWIYAICVNAARQHRRRAHIRRDRLDGKVPEQIVEAGQEERVDRLRAQMLLDRVIDMLDDDKRAVFVLYEIEGLTMSEISEALRVPLQTAYSRLHAARKVAEREFAKWRQMQESA